MGPQKPPSSPGSPKASTFICDKYSQTKPSQPHFQIHLFCFLFYIFLRKVHIFSKGESCSGKQLIQHPPPPVSLESTLKLLNILHISSFHSTPNLSDTVYFGLKPTPREVLLLLLLLLVSFIISAYCFCFLSIFYYTYGSVDYTRTC